MNINLRVLQFILVLQNMGITSLTLRLQIHNGQSLMIKESETLIQTIFKMNVLEENNGEEKTNQLTYQFTKRKLKNVLYCNLNLTRKWKQQKKHSNFLLLKKSQKHKNRIMMKNNKKSKLRNNKNLKNLHSQHHLIFKKSHTMCLINQFLKSTNLMNNFL